MGLYDCIIVGGGPAGLGGAVYTSRDGLKTLILEKYMPGGQINVTDRIENYPGIERIDGPGLVERMQKQAESFGAEAGYAAIPDHGRGEGPNRHLESWTDNYTFVKTGLTQSPKLVSMRRE